MLKQDQEKKETESEEKEDTNVVKEPTYTEKEIVTYYVNEINKELKEEADIDNMPNTTTAEKNELVAEYEKYAKEKTKEISTKMKKKYSTSDTLTNKYADEILNQVKENVYKVLYLQYTKNDMIDEVMEQLKGFNTLLTKYINSTYSGKQLTGSEVIMAANEYVNSSDFSVRIVESSSNQFQLGGYAVKLSQKNIKGNYDSTSQGYKEVTYTGKDGYVELNENTKSSIKEIINEISNSDYYYSYVMKDSLTNKTVGILFVKEGLTGTISQTINN